MNLDKEYELRYRDDTSLSLHSLTFTSFPVLGEFSMLTLSAEREERESELLLTIDWQNKEICLIGMNSLSCLLLIFQWSLVSLSHHSLHLTIANRISFVFPPFPLIQRFINYLLIPMILIPSGSFPYSAKSFRFHWESLHFLSCTLIFRLNKVHRISIETFVMFWIKIFSFFRSNGREISRGSGSN